MLAKDTSQLASIFSSVSEFSVSRRVSACWHHFAAIGQEAWWCHSRSDVFSAWRPLINRTVFRLACTRSCAPQKTVCSDSSAKRRGEHSVSEQWRHSLMCMNVIIIFGRTSALCWSLAVLITRSLRLGSALENVKCTFCMLTNLFVNYSCLPQM